MFLCKLRGVPACDLGTLVAAKCIAKINQNLGSRPVIMGAACSDELIRLAKPFLRRIDHLLHSMLTLLLFFRRFAPRCGIALLLLVNVMFATEDFSPF